MTIEIVDFPINHGDFPVRYVKLPEGMFTNSAIVAGAAPCILLVRFRGTISKWGWLWGFGI